MGYNKNKIIDVLCAAISARNSSDIYFAEYSSIQALNNNPSQCMPWHRLSIMIEGKNSIDYFSDGERKTTFLYPGDVVVMPPFCWLNQNWEDNHNSISLVLERNYLRLVCLDYSTEKKVFWPPDYYYHIEDSLSESTILAIRSLTSIVQKNVLREVTNSLVDCILQFALADLQKSVSQNHGKAYTSWLKLTQYIEENYHSKITRAYLKDKFNLSEVYISKLFKRFSGSTMNNVLMSIRLENASFLLIEKNLTVEEIAWHCGYNSPSFFIKIFKKQYGLTPSMYRQTKLYSKK